MSGRLIAFEGIEGAGKSTQVRLLEERLQAAGERVQAFREPGGTAFGEAVRTLFKSQHDIGALSELMLIASSRAQLMRSVIQPALEAGTYVLLDRFVDSTLAYQGFGRGLDADRVRELNAWVTEDTVADCVFYLRLRPEDAVHRLLARGEPKDRMECESLAFFERVVQGFDALSQADPERYEVLDALQPAATLGELVWERVAAIRSLGR